MMWCLSKVLVVASKLLWDFRLVNFIETRSTSVFLFCLDYIIDSGAFEYKLELCRYAEIRNKSFERSFKNEIVDYILNAKSY